MIDWLTPLGLLGLLAIAVLILIYILKPNFQQKVISSTYVWKLSLKYRKKRIPINRFRNILIFICQVLIFTACAIILTQPFIGTEKPAEYSEKIAIIDASASMRASTDGTTRFERAVEKVRALTDQVLAEDGVMTVILAGEPASFRVQRLGAENRAEIYDALDALLSDPLGCGYAHADIDGAMTLAEAVIAENPEVEVLLYTGVEYIDKGNVTVVDMRESGEWNAALLDCTATLEGNYYTFTAKVACYGLDRDLMVYCKVYGANGQEATLPPIEFMDSVQCMQDQTSTVTFTTANTPNAIYSFDHVEFRFDDGMDLFTDSFGYDNSFRLFGGTKQKIKVQLVSATNFTSDALLGMQNNFRNLWDIDFVDRMNGDEFATEGYDYYIFEETMPDKMPTDGAVFLINPTTIPDGLNIKIADDPVRGEALLAPGGTHPITQYLNPAKIEVTQHLRVLEYEDGGFQPLLYCNGDPVLLLRDDAEAKVAVLSFSLRYSTIAVRFDFSVMMASMFMHFVPSTIEAQSDDLTSSYVFSVGDTVRLHSRGQTLSVSGGSDAVSATFDTFPAEFTFSAGGTYTFTQVLASGEEVNEFVYVKVSDLESNIFREEDVLANPTISQSYVKQNYDLLIYLAAALVALLFAEWWLQTREHF